MQHCVCEGHDRVCVAREHGSITRGLNTPLPRQQGPYAHAAVGRCRCKYCSAVRLCRAVFQKADGIDTPAVPVKRAAGSWPGQRLCEQEEGVIVIMNVRQRDRSSWPGRRFCEQEEGVIQCEAERQRSSRQQAAVKGRPAVHHEQATRYGRLPCLWSSGAECPS